jgi:hypothetical protein
MEHFRDWVELITHLAWPAVVIAGTITFRGQIISLLENVAQRPLRLSAFKVQIELGQLAKAEMPQAKAEALAGQFISESYPLEIASSIRNATGADYLVLDIGSGDEKRWLTSRLYILAATLERIRGLRCLVFVSGEERNAKFICSATPRDVRWSLGVWSPWFEQAFASAYGALTTSNPPLEPNAFRGGLTDGLIDKLIARFLAPPNGVSRAPAQNETIPPQQWEKLEKSGVGTIFEHAEWINAGRLADILGGKLSRSSVSVRTGASSAETAKAVLERAGTFVALVDDQGVFKDIVDRQRVLDQIAIQAAAQIPDEKPRSRRPIRSGREAKVR